MLGAWNVATPPVGKATVRPPYPQMDRALAQRADMDDESSATR